MDALLRDYLRGLEARKLSPESVRTARSVLTILEQMAGQPLLKVTADNLDDWQAQRAGEVSARTLRKNVSAVRCFYRWAVRSGRMRVDPTARMDTPKTPRLLPRPMPEERLAVAMAAADDRMRVILGLAAHAALRACEIASLSWSEVALDVDEPWIRVVGKGSKERMLDVSPLLGEVLRALPGGRRGPVIRRADGRHGHNTPVRISKLANTHLHSCGVPDTFHATRHRFLTLLCRFAGIRVAQEAAGHSTPGPTAIYTRVVREDMRPGVVRAGQFFPEAS